MTRRIPADATTGASRRARRRISGLLCVLCAVCAGLVVPALGRPANAQAAAKGLSDPLLRGSSADHAVVDAAVKELGRGVLGARFTVITVDWADVQPDAPPAPYNETYFANLDYIIARLRAAGVRAILTAYQVPEWASDQSLWDSPPAGYDKGYHNFFLPAPDHIADYGKLGAELARRYAKYGVLYECWNEPNLAWFLYPQAISGEPYLAASTYLKLLRAYSQGIKSVQPNATVIAGATAPYGADDALSTSPQSWATYLKDSGAAQYFDAYSHHPYQISGRAPNLPPYDGQTTVTLYNISQLLRLFPGKPFYLTEYGYSTKEVAGHLPPVSDSQQAAYLRQAYAMVARHRRIKALVWYPLQDSSTWYAGLKRLNGSRKPSWYAFAKLK